MEVHERFYGMAMDEIKGGADRRHDLWAKAIALSKGEVEKTEAIYMDLLARLFSETATKADREELKQTAVNLAVYAGVQGKRIGFNILCLAVWGALSFMIYLGGTNWADKMYEKFAYDFAVHYEPGQGNDKQETFTDPKGHQLTEPTRKEYYQAMIAENTGIEFPGLSEMAKSSAHDDYYPLVSRYGDEGASLLGLGKLRAENTFQGLMRSLMETNRNYIEAAKTNFIPWLLLTVICLGAWYLLTREALKAYRRGYFKSPGWLK